MEGAIVSEETPFCLLSVPYLEQEEIKMCKKFIYSYSTRLAFHMPRSYHLTIFNYSIVVPASGKLSPIYFKDLKGERLTSNKRISINISHSYH